jgi:predicted nicotinamide N-methyase
VIPGYATTDTLLEVPGHRIRMTRMADAEALLADIEPVSFADGERLPYWAELWPSAVALAHYIAKHLNLDGRGVLELGCGLGLVSVVAALQGARVLCTDYEELALAFARWNARGNACSGMRFRLVDWRQPALRRRYDCILASNVIYEARSFGPLTTLLQRYLARGGVALLAEPGRINAPPFFTLLRQRGFTYRKHTQCVQWEGAHRISIYVIRHQKNQDRPPRKPA